MRAYCRGLLEALLESLLEALLDSSGSCSCSVLAFFLADAALGESRMFGISVFGVSSFFCLSFLFLVSFFSFSFLFLVSFSSFLSFLFFLPPSLFAILLVLGIVLGQAQLD